MADWDRVQEEAHKQLVRATAIKSFNAVLAWRVDSPAVDFYAALNEALASVIPLKDNIQIKGLQMAIMMLREHDKTLTNKI